MVLLERMTLVGDELFRTPRFNRVVRLRDLKPSGLKDTPAGGGSVAGTIVFLLSNFTISSGSSATTSVAWDDIAQDDGGFFDGGAPTFLTADVDGWYSVWCNLQMTFSGTTFCRAWMISDTYGGARFGQMDLFDSGGRNSMAATIFLAAGDGVRVRVNADGTTTVEDAGADLLTSSHFGMARLG